MVFVSIRLEKATTASTSSKKYGDCHGFSNYPIVRFIRGLIYRHIANEFRAIVFAADTWVHLSTKTVPLVVASPLLSAIPYGTSLIPSCSLTNFTYRNEALQSCVLNPAATNVFLQNSATALEVLNNMSQAMTVKSYAGEVTYLGPPSSLGLAQRDYNANTYGMSTKCSPASVQCGLNAAYGASTPFNCSPKPFSGDVTMVTDEMPDPSFQMTYFTDLSMTSNNTAIQGVTNPFYFGMGALVNPWGPAPPINNPELIQPVHGGMAYILLCNSTVYDISYDTINNTAKRFETTPSNLTVANIFQGAIGTVGVATDFLKQAASVAPFSATVQGMADRFAFAFSQAALAVGSSAVQPIQAVEAQERTTSLVTRVEKGPLYTLIGANLIFVLLGIMLAIIALATSAEEVREIQSRLGIAGLVADRFEGERAKEGTTEVEGLFEERLGGSSRRVFIQTSPRGGFEYASL